MDGPVFPALLVQHDAILDADGSLADAEAAAVAINSACASLDRALDCNRHQCAQDRVASAARQLRLAAGHAPAHADALVTLACRLDAACDCWGHPYAGTVKTVCDDAAAIQNCIILRSSGNGTNGKR